MIPKAPHKIVLFFLLLSFTACNTHKITRKGYSLKKSDYWDCKVPVLKNMKVRSHLQTVGVIELGNCATDKIFTVTDAIALLEKEGCALEADSVNIVQENDSTEWNTCYKCQAEFYVKAKPQSPEYISEKMNEKVRRDRNKAIWVGFTSGFSISYLLWEVYKWYR